MSGGLVRPWDHGVVLGEYRPRALGDALYEVARGVPDRVAVEDDRRSLKYRALVCAVDRVRDTVRAGEPGSVAPVCLVIEHGIDAVIGLLGVIAAGRIAVPLDARDPLFRLAAHHERVGGRLWLQMAATDKRGKPSRRERPSLKDRRSPPHEARDRSDGDDVDREAGEGDAGAGGGSLSPSRRDGSMVWSRARRKSATVVRRTTPGTGTGVPPMGTR